MSQTGSRLVDRVGSERLFGIGLATTWCVGAAILVAVLLHAALAGVLPWFFLTLTSSGLVGPNASALAVHRYPHPAGSASALIGLTQLGTGAAVAPIVGAAGNGTAVPMAIVMASSGLMAVGIRTVTERRMVTSRAG